MKKYIIFIFILLIAILLPSCGQSNVDSDSGDSAPTYQTITAEEAYEAMADFKDFILLDVRTKEEYDSSHIDGAILLPDYDIEDKAEEILPDKEIEIFLYCRSGRRSAEAAQRLIDMGYKNVYDFGGIINWPYEIVNSKK